MYNVQADVIKLNSNSWLVTSMSRLSSLHMSCTDMVWARISKKRKSIKETTKHLCKRECW